jgi:hypothetical protein
MDITTLAAWGEFMGGIGVIASLIYLAGQIRINTRTVRASNFDGLLDAGNQATAITIDPEAASLCLRGLDDFVALSAEDQMRFQGIMVPRINAVYRAWNLYQQRLLDDRGWEIQVHALKDHLQPTGARQWWETAHHYWSDDFREFVEEATAK